MTEAQARDWVRSIFATPIHPQDALAGCTVEGRVAEHFVPIITERDQLRADLLVANRTIAQLREDGARVQGRLIDAEALLSPSAIVLSTAWLARRDAFLGSLASGSSTGEADKCRCGHPVSQPATHVRSKACAPPPAPEPAPAPTVTRMEWHRFECCPGLGDCTDNDCIYSGGCHRAGCAEPSNDAIHAEPSAPASAQGTPGLEPGSTAWANWITGKVDALSKRVHALIQWADHGARERAWVRAQMRKEAPQPAPVERHGSKPVPIEPHGFVCKVRFDIQYKGVAWDWSLPCTDSCICKECGQPRSAAVHEEGGK